MAMVSLLMFWLPFAAADDSEAVMKIVRQMVAANRQQDYRGIFVYEHAGLLGTVQVVHARRDGVEFENLFHLDGPERRIHRNSKQANCEMDAGRHYSRFGSSEHLIDRNLQLYYNLYQQDADRIAGRSVDVVHLVPRDKHRYGFVLAVDKETGLLLQSLLVGPEQKIVERFQYIQVNIDGDIDENQFLPPGVSLEQALAEAGGCNPPLSTSAASGLKWGVTWMPPGFELLGQKHHTVEHPVDLKLYSDGMTEFSVFVDYQSGDRFPPVHARRGATVAYLSKLDIPGQPLAICVVGEIPMATAQRVAESVALVAGD